MENVGRKSSIALILVMLFVFLALYTLQSPKEPPQKTEVPKTNTPSLVPTQTSEPTATPTNRIVPSATVIATATIEPSLTPTEVPPPSATSTITPTLEPTLEPTMTPPTPSPTATISPVVVITSSLEIFIHDFNDAMQTESIDWLYEHLHPAVFERYSPEDCAQYLARTVQPLFNIMVINITGPEVWEWRGADVSIMIENAFTVDAELTVNGETSRSAVHFAQANGDFRWFTACNSEDE